MNELQASLLGIGILIVVGVYAFNRLQERKFRRVAEKAFPPKNADVLLDSGTPDPAETLEPAHFHESSRIEPIVSTLADFESEADVGIERDNQPVAEDIKEDVKFTQVDATMPDAEVSDSPGDQSDSLLDEAIQYIVQIHPSEPVIGTAALIDAIHQQGDFGKRVHWYGRHAQTGLWEEVGQSGAVDYHQVAATLQLADRSGPISDPDLAIFCNQVQLIAEALVAVAEFPGRMPALALAGALDQFCADVDVQVGANVITQSGVPFAATKVRAMAEAAGMKLQPDGAFHFYNDEGADLFSLANLDPTPFSADNIRHLTTHGITIMFDVPMVADGVRVFNQMLMLARQMASTLGGQVVDDNRKPLSDAGIARIKQQLADIYTRMDTQQIKSGGARALRLFS